MFSYYLFQFSIRSEKPAVTSFTEAHSVSKVVLFSLFEKIVIVNFLNHYNDGFHLVDLIIMELKIQMTC